MRQTSLAVLGVFLAVASCGQGFAEESPSWWWPFGTGEDAAETPAAPAAPAAPATTPQPTAADPHTANSRSPFMPKLEWPHLSTPSVSRSAPRAQRSRAATRGKLGALQKRNAWAPPNSDRAERPSATSPWETVTGGAHRMGESTRNAWHKTLDVLVPGDVAADPGVDQREPRVSWWSRLWGAEEEQPEGPRTVTEWMAQDRLDP